MSRFACLILAASLLHGCGGREWVDPAAIEAELQNRERFVDQQLSTRLNLRDRQRLEIAQAALGAARRALDEDNRDLAQQELQVAIDLLERRQ